MVESVLASDVLVEFGGSCPDFYQRFGLQNKEAVISNWDLKNDELESKANAPPPKSFRLPSEVMKFSVYMIEKYGEDYKAMAKDPKNYYQDTPAVIRRKINRFKNTPCQWNGYLRTKGLIEGEPKPDEYHIDINEITN
ncbi:nucleolar protein 16, partial [Nephila pilipes]